MTRRGGSRKRVALAAALGLLGSATLGSAQPAPSLSPQVPADVVIPEGFPANPIDFFDDYSWRAFVALIWPVDPANPGAPKPGSGLDDAGSRVFETYRSNWETFQPGGAVPPAWTEEAPITPCKGVTPGPGEMIIAGFTKFEELGQAGKPDLVGPLIAQNRTYVRYTTGYNKLQYEHIVSRKLFLRANLTPQGTTSPNGAIVVKSSWMDLAGVANANEYYSRTAWLVEADGACSKHTIGLVGLHIVHKTPSRPQWIWSTFEHVDTAPDVGSSGKAFAFNDGTGAKMPTKPPHGMPPPFPVPAPFNVERVKPIHAKTAATNAKWGALLTSQNSVWRFYRLVMTQWPLAKNSPNTPGTPGNTFPGSGPNGATAFANVTMETFDQRNAATGCMNCHEPVRVKTDFVWSIDTHAFPIPAALAPAPPTGFPSPQAAPVALSAEMKQLQRLLKAGVKANEQAK